MIEVEIPDKNITVEFPDGTSEDEIMNLINRDIYGKEPKSEEPSAIKELGRGLIHGVYGIGESIGTGLEYLGRRIEPDVDPGFKPVSDPELRKYIEESEIVSAPAQKMRDLTAGERLQAIQKMREYKDEGIGEKEATSRAVAETRQNTLRKQDEFGEFVTNQGKLISDFWGKQAKKWEPPKRIGGKNVWDNPELLKSPVWWAYNVGDMLPSLAVAMIPATGTYRGITAASKLSKLNPQTVARIAKLGASIVGGATGGALEGTATYKAVIEKGGTEEEAARAAELMTLFSAGLNSISMGTFLRSAGSGFSKKILKLGLSGVVEGLTEGAEEPAEVVAIIGSKILNGKPVPNNIQDLFFESLKEATSIAPIAGVTGVLGGIGGQVTTRKKADLSEDEKEQVPTPEKEEEQDISAGVDQIKQLLRDGEITIADIKKGRKELSDENPIARAYDQVLEEEPHIPKEVEDVEEGKRRVEGRIKKREEPRRPVPEQEEGVKETEADRVFQTQEAKKLPEELKRPKTRKDLVNKIIKSGEITNQQLENLRRTEKLLKIASKRFRENGMIDDAKRVEKDIDLINRAKKIKTPEELKREEEEIDRELAEAAKEEKVPEPKRVKKPHPRKGVIKPIEERKNLRAAITNLQAEVEGTGRSRIDPENFRGEIKDLPAAAKRLFKKGGVKIDEAQKILREKGFMGKDEDIWDMLRDPENLKRGRVFAEGVKKGAPTEQERRVKKEIEREPEAPPKGEYVTIQAEDLPKGKNLTIIEDKSREGRDVYEVTEKDPFEIKLTDGQTITLKPRDRVQVLKKDLPQKPKAKPVEPKAVKKKPVPTKKTKAKVVPEKKEKPKPGYAWIDEQKRPIYDYKERKDGKFNVQTQANLKDPKKRWPIVEANDIVSFPGEVEPSVKPKRLKRQQTLEKRTEQLESAINQLTSKWIAFPNVQVLNYFAELPPTIRRNIAQKGVEERIRGVFDKDKVYLIANNINTTQEGIKVLVHEVVGHYGLKKVLGRDYGRTMREIYDANKAEIKHAARFHKYDFSTVKGRALATDEWLSQQAEFNPKNTWVQKIIAKIKEFLRNLGVKFKWSEAEIVSLLVKSREFVERGGKIPRVKLFDISPEIKEGIPTEEVPQFSLEDEKQAEEINRRIGNLPEFKDFVEAYEKHDKTTNEGLEQEVKEIQQLKKTKPVKEFEKRFGAITSDEDLKWFRDEVLKNPAALAEKFPKTIGKMFEAEEDAREKRHLDIFKLYEGDLDRIQREIPKDKNKMGEFINLVNHWEDRMPNTLEQQFLSPKPDEDLKINPKYYEAFEAQLKKDHNSDVVDAYLILRHVYDNILIEYDKLMRIHGVNKNRIQEFRKNIGKRNNYFPHERRGDTGIVIKHGDEVVYQRHFFRAIERLRKASTGRGPKQVAREWLQEQLASGKLKGTEEDYYISNPFKLKEVDQKDFFGVDTEQIQTIINLAAERVGKPSDELYKGKTLQDELSQAVADVLRTPGFSRHAIERKGIPGHETEDIFGITFNYLSGFIGFKHKIDRIKKHHEVLKKLDRRTNEYKYARQYFNDMIENSTMVDRIVDNVRGLFFVKYLGFIPKSGMINLTQNAVMAYPVLSTYITKAGPKLGRGMKDTRRALTSKEAWTQRGEVRYPGIRSEIEKQAIRDMIETGSTIDLYTRELRGNLPAVGTGKYFRKFAEKSGVFMGLAEKFNRTSTGLTAFRAAYNEGVNYDPKKERFVWRYKRVPKRAINTKGNYDLSLKFARHIINKSHFVYGKHNLPSSMRGGKFRKWLRSAYTFRSFSHNYLLVTSHMALNQGKIGKVATAKSLAMIFAFGGLTSIPFFKILSEIWMKVLDKEDEDAITKIREKIPTNILRDVVTYGLPGAFGLDFSGSLSIEVPRGWGDIIGVPWAIGEDTRNMYQSWRSGQKFRSLAESPVTPMFLRNAARGYELHFFGQRTRSGRDIGEIGKIGPRKISKKEAILKGLGGVQPTKMSKGYGAYTALQKAERVVQSKKKYFADRYVNAFKRGDEKEQLKVRDELELYNTRMREEGKTYMMIDISDSVQHRMQPSYMQIPTQLRGNALRITEQWQ